MLGPCGHSGRAPPDRRRQLLSTQPDLTHSAISRRPAGRRKPRSNGGSAWTAVIRSAPLPSCPTYGVKFRLEAAPLPRTVSGVNQNGYSGPITSVLLTSPIPAGSTRPGREFAINAQEGCPERRERTLIRVWRSHSLCLTTGERSQRSGPDRWALERVASGRREPEPCQNPRLVRPADQRSTPMADGIFLDVGALTSGNTEGRFTPVD